MTLRTPRVPFVDTAGVLTRDAVAFFNSIIEERISAVEAMVQVALRSPNSESSPAPPLSCFSAYFAASTANNVTGDATPYDVVFDTAVFDNESNYATGTGLFTAKETGKYLFSAGVTVRNLGAAHAAMLVSVVLGSGPVYALGYGGSFNSSDGAGFIARGGCNIVPMAAGDTAKVRVEVDGSTKTVGVFGQSSHITFFSGARLV